MKKPLSTLIRFLPFVILFGIMIYLRSLNSVPEVYIDLTSTKMSFDISEETAFELIAGLPVDSLQLRNFDLKLKLGKVLNTKNRTVTNSKELRIVRDDQTADSQIQLSKQDYLYLKKLHLPIFSQVEIIKEDKTITLALTHGANATENIRGEIGVGGKFLFAGRNVKLQGSNQYSDDDLLSVSTHPFFKKLVVDANKATMKMILFVSPEDETVTEIIKNLFVQNISFVETDVATRKNNETSTILSGNIQIAGIDFFKKRFLLKEEKLAQNDFIDLADNDQYFISSIRVNENGFEVSMSCEEATELEIGKRITLLRSIFPSLLDFLIAEPSNKTFWTILVFVITQFSLLQRILKSHFRKGKSTE